MPTCRPLQLNITCGCPICPYHGTPLHGRKLHRSNILLYLIIDRSDATNRYWEGIIREIGIMHTVCVVSTETLGVEFAITLSSTCWATNYVIISATSVWVQIQRFGKNYC